MSRRAHVEVEILDDILVEVMREFGDCVPLTALGPTPVDPRVVAELRARVAARSKPKVSRHSRYARRGGVA